jgi:NAD(P)-dependent dehydrogenase (short-subunit alcohol dehydrogenase family)
VKGSGIGRATAIAFATAGASRLILVGRTESTLQETAKLLSEGSQAKVEVFAASVTDETKIKALAEQVGEWDVLVLNAAHRITPSSIAGASLQDWWQHHEVNVKSIVIAAQAFIPKAKSGAAFYTMMAGAIVMPPAYTPGLSSYFSAKIAQCKVVEFLAAENPGIFFCAVHPGMIETDVFMSSGANPAQLPMDNGMYSKPT